MGWHRFGLRSGAVISLIAICTTSATFHFLGGILLLEVIIACLWKYEQRFFVLLIITFTWAGMNCLCRALGPGDVGWCWLPAPSSASSFGQRLHAVLPVRCDLIAFFCVCAAFVSASVSTFVRMASLKALSLMLLFLYCVSGARLAALGREKSFFHGLVWGGEIAVFLTAGCYFGLGKSVWGNPNSLGAVMSVAVFPILTVGMVYHRRADSKGAPTGFALLFVLIWFFSAWLVPE